MRGMTLERSVLKHVTAPGLAPLANPWAGPNLCHRLPRQRRRNRADHSAASPAPLALPPPWLQDRDGRGRRYPALGGTFALRTRLPVAHRMRLVFETSAYKS
jgi:hypothetical protein